jgi:hypothetical protein
MSLLSFIKCIWSPHANDTEAKVLSECVKDKKTLSERERDTRILEFLVNPKPTVETLEELAKLMGRADEPKFRFDSSA